MWYLLAGKNFPCLNLEPVATLLIDDLVMQVQEGTDFVRMHSSSISFADKLFSTFRGGKAAKTPARPEKAAHGVALGVTADQELRLFACEASHRQMRPDLPTQTSSCGMRSGSICVVLVEGRHDLFQGR